MNKVRLSSLCGLMLILALSASALASDLTINGAVYFKCNFVSTYMEKHGYLLIEKDLYLQNLKIDRYAASGAEVYIKNKNNTVVGSGKTDQKGSFSISVPEDYNYRVVVRFHDRETEYTVSYSDAKNIIADLGYFDTEKVGSWIQIPPLRYCYTCDIRYLETKKSL